LIDRELGEAGRAVPCHPQPAELREEHSWPDGVGPRSLAGLPEWLPRIALADRVDDDLLRMAAASAGAPLDHAQLDDLWRRLGRAGLLTPAGSGPEPHSLKPGVREFMLAHLDHTPGRLARVRHELLMAGLQLSAPGTGSQLIRWAWQAADWSALELLLLHLPPEFEPPPLDPRLWMTRIPRQARLAHPLLSLPHAAASAIDASRRRDGTRPELDLGVYTGSLLREGGQLHSGWRRHSDINAVTVAGALWMISQAAVSGSTGDPRRDAAWATHRELEQVLSERSRTGPLPASTSLAIFHTASAAVATLRADWREVHSHAELAMLLSPECSVLGFVAASLLSASSFFSGSPNGRRRGEEFLSTHIGHACLTATWMSGLLDFPRAFSALRDLDRAAAESALSSLGEIPGARWFDDSLLILCAKAQAGILWQDAGQALAAFDAAIASRGGLEAIQDAAQPHLLRSRLDLLVNLGDFDQAAGLAEQLKALAGMSLARVPTARLQLCRGNLSEACDLADAGLYSAELAVADRAALHVIKAAAELLAGNNDALVDRSVTAACVVCQEGDTALPFALIPRPVMVALLDLHAPHADGAPCFLRARLDPDTVSQLRQSYASARSPIRLTPRERSLLPLLATPAPLREIADDLFLSVNTVRKQVVTLRAKLGARNRSELVARAAELGLVHGVASGDPLPHPAERALGTATGSVIPPTR